MLNKRAITPLIATILLIGFTVVLAAIIITWGSSLTKSILERSESIKEREINCFSDYKINIKKIEVGSNKINLLIQNDGSGNIDKFKVRIYGINGIDNIEIMEGFTTDFVIKSHIKDKETEEITTQTHQIPFKNVNVLFFWIKKWKIGEKHKCYDFANKLGYSDWKELWKERKEYFDLYYYPIKVLEALKIIKYSGKGEITRIK